MNPIQIGRKRFSKLFWEIVCREVDLDWMGDSVSEILSEQEEYREKAAYKTGSISYEDALDLFYVTHHFKPYNIAEVGTFIGNSTRVMRSAFPSCTVYTCDVSNKICVSPGDHEIKHYYKTPSHEMFKDLAFKGETMDMVYLDGRLSQDDMEPLSKIIHKDTVFVLDDFEGTEKGVANAMLLSNLVHHLSGEQVVSTLIYPRQGNKTALIVPFHLIQFVNQEAS